MQLLFCHALAAIGIKLHHLRHQMIDRV